MGSCVRVSSDEVVVARCWRRFVPLPRPPPPVDSSIAMPARRIMQGIPLAVIGVGAGNGNKKHLMDAAKHFTVDLAFPHEWVDRCDLKTIIGDEKFYVTCKNFVWSLFRVIKTIARRGRRSRTLACGSWSSTSTAWLI